MVCVHCGENTKVINSRSQRRANQVWRRRQCVACGTVFTTTEAADYAANWLVRNKSGYFSPFQRDKLFVSLHNSFQHRKTGLRDASALTDTVIQKLRPQLKQSSIEADQIRQAVQVALNRFDKLASAHYSALHAD